MNGGSQMGQRRPRPLPPGRPNSMSFGGSQKLWTSTATVVKFVLSSVSLPPEP